MKNQTKKDGVPEQITTVSLGAHVSQASRDKLTAYQKTHDHKNVNDALNHLLSALPEPEPVKEEKVPDPNQSQLPGCEE